MAADFSGCIEMTAAYVNYYNFPSGKIGVAWDCTGDADENIYGKDPTSATDITRAVFHLEYCQLSCGSTERVRLLDGSTGNIIAGIASACQAGAAGEWNFKDDPLRCLTGDVTLSLCISAQDGYNSGFIKGYWGV